MGPTGWAAVLALGIPQLRHPRPPERGDPWRTCRSRIPSALRGLGAGRMQIAGARRLPDPAPPVPALLLLPVGDLRRVATLLGILGIASLGYWIDEARHARFYDEMMLFVLLGAALVIVGDVVSAIARGFVRRAT